MTAQELQAIRNLIAHVEKTGSIEELLRTYREQTPKLLDEVERLREALSQIAESEDPWYVGTVRHQEVAHKALERKGETT